MTEFFQGGNDYLVYLALFIGFLLAFEGLRQLLSRNEDQEQAMNRRMRFREKGASDEQLQAALLKVNAALDDDRPHARFSRMLRQAGFTIDLGRFFLIQVAMAFLVFLALGRILPLPATLLGTVLAGLAPVIFVVIARQQRLEKMTKQLPDALDLMARGLTVGHPLSVTVANVAHDMPDPIGSEFGLIQDQVNYGDDITEAFTAFAQRVGTEDARYASVSVGIQHTTGGNLAHVLRVLSTVIRDRATMRKKIHAISAEGRLSALILSVLPFLIFGIVNFTSPGFYGEVWTDPLFKFFAGAALTLIVLQTLILFRMVNFKF